MSQESALTVDSAVEKIGFGRFQIYLVAVCGIVQAADAMEMILLSLLGHSLQCQWWLTSAQIAWLTTSVFIGTILGAPLIGAVSDRYGRWNALFLSASLIAFYGALSAGSPNFPWILVLRGMVGFAIGGLMPLTSTLTSEFLPVKYRALLLVGMMAFWTLGSLLEVLLAWLCLGSDGVLRIDGWRWMLAATSVPLFLVLPLFAWLPRSPMFLLAAGRPADALAQLNRVARMNGRPELAGPLLTDPVAKKARGDLRGLFANGTMIRLTLLLLVFWSCNGFLYFGLVLLSTELPSLPHRCLQDWSATSEASQDKAHYNCCQALSSSEYATTAFATLGELFGIVTILLFIDTCGRRAVMAVNSGALCILLICLMFCMPPKALAVMLFLCRSCSSAAYTTVCVYTNEAYPTTIRTLGMGVNCAASQIGTILSPFVAQVLLPTYSVATGLLVYAGAALLAAVTAVMLPFDTKGRPLLQTVEETAAAQETPPPGSKFDVNDKDEANSLRVGEAKPKSYSSLDKGKTGGGESEMMDSASKQ